MIWILSSLIWLGPQAMPEAMNWELFVQQSLGADYELMDESLQQRFRQVIEKRLSRSLNRLERKEWKRIDDMSYESRVLSEPIRLIRDPRNGGIVDIQTQSWSLKVSVAHSIQKNLLTRTPEEILELLETAEREQLSFSSSVE